MEYLNTDISLLPPAPFQIQPTSAAQNISYSLHRNTNRYISFFLLETFIHVSFYHLYHWA